MYNRDWAAAATTEAGVFVFGGWMPILFADEEGICGGTKVVECYDPNANRWQSSTAWRMPYFVVNQAAAIDHGRVVLCGGRSPVASPNSPMLTLDTVSYFDHRSKNCWQSGPNMPRPRWFHALIRDEHELIAIGGVGKDETEKAVDVLEPRINRWRTLDWKLRFSFPGCSLASMQ